MKLIIEDDEGHKTTVPFVRDEITVGREEGNTIRLTERNVSRRHARFYRQGGGIWVEDLKSYNGIKVNGDRIETAVQLRDGDLVQIGDFDLAVQPEAERQNGASTGKVTEQMRALPDFKLDDTQPGVSPLETDPGKPAAPVAKREATAIIRVPLAGGESPVDAVDVPIEQAPRLVIVSTELSGREFACIRSALTLGRGDECDIVINHRSLSRVHCRLWRDGAGAWKVADLGSSNRVQVNGEEYAETALHSGDVISLGHVKLRFVAPGEEFTFVPEGSRRRSPVPIFVGVALAASLLGGTVVFLLAHNKKKAVEPAPPVAQQQQPAEEAPPPTALQPDKREAHPAPQPEQVAQPAPTPAKPQPAKPAPPAPEPMVAKPEPKAEPKPEPKPEPAEAKAAPAEDKQTQQIEDAAARAEALVAKRDIKGAQRALAAVKAPGSNVNFDQAEKRVAEEAANQRLVSEYAKRAPTGDALNRLHDVANSSSPFHAEAAAIVAKAERNRTKEPAGKKTQVASAKEPAPAIAPVLQASAADDKDKRAEDAYNSGLKSMNDSEYDDAAKSLRQATLLKPSVPRYHKALGSCLAVLGRYDEAKAEYNKFLELVPNSPDAALVRQALRQFDGK